MEKIVAGMLDFRGSKLLVASELLLAWRLAAGALRRDPLQVA
jgi:hypothetical protein